MKNFKQSEWVLKRTEIIDDINSIPNSKFRINDFVEKIKRNIPNNSINKDEVINCLGGVGSGVGGIIIGNKNISYGPAIDKQKKDLIEILNLIELKRFRMKNVIYYIRKKIDWKWIIGILVKD